MSPPYPTTLALAIPTDNFDEALATLATAQIKNADYVSMCHSLAGPMLTQIGQVFPRHLSMVYLLTDYKRRQVWHAYIAGAFGNEDILDPITERQRLLEWGNAKLLRHAYQEVPTAFENALNRLGVRGHDPSVYLQLHHLMMESEENRKSFSHASIIHPKTLECMALLPVDLRSVKLAKRFRRVEDVNKLVFAVGMLSVGNDEQRAIICKNVKEAADRNRPVSRVLEKEYTKTPFATQVVPNGKNCRYISNADELATTAIKFKNCVRQFAYECIRNEQQFYLWSNADEDVAVICLKSDHPYGWRLDEVRCVENDMPDDELQANIETYFSKYGVCAMPNFESMLHQISHALGDHHRNDPVESIYHVMDELLEDDEAS